MATAQQRSKLNWCARGRGATFLKSCEAKLWSDIS